jgi:ATP-binding protein involved in chromosome partitioning
MPSTTAKPILEQVRAALSAVLDPTFERPLGELGLIESVEVEQLASGSHAKLRLRVMVPSEPHRTRLEAEVRRALFPLGVREIEVAWDLVISTRQLTGEDLVPGVKNVILVMSGKGGVGKSTCAANLALALQRAGARVGLLDADVYGPSVPTMFGLDGAHPTSGDGVHINPIERFGVQLMSIGFLVEDSKQAVVWRGPMLSTALTQFLKDVDWGKLDYLVLDLPPGTGDVALTLAQKVKVTGAVIVTTPQEVALVDVYKAVSMCEKLSIPLLGVIENMSYFVDTAGVRHDLFGKGGGEKVASFAKAPLLGQVPIEQAIRECGDQGTPIVQATPGSPSALAFELIADKLARAIAVEHWKSSGGTKAPAGEGPTRLKIVR